MVRVQEGHCLKVSVPTFLQNETCGLARHHDQLKAGECMDQSMVGFPLRFSHSPILGLRSQKSSVSAWNGMEGNRNEIS